MTFQSSGELTTSGARSGVSAQQHDFNGGYNESGSGMGEVLSLFFKAALTQGIYLGICHNRELNSEFILSLLLGLNYNSLACCIT